MEIDDIIFPEKLPVTSTPKAPKRPIMICNFCDKEYVSQFYFKKHIQTHTFHDHNENNVNVHLNVSQEIHLDATNLSFNNVFNVTNADQSGFKTPAIPGSKKLKPKGKVPQRKPKFVCTYCRKGYICGKSFKSHVRIHVMQAAESHFPRVTQIFGNIEEISMSALIKVTNAPSSGKVGDQFRCLMGEIVNLSSTDKWKKFNEAIFQDLIQPLDGKKILLPSALLTTLFDHMDNIYSSDELYNKYVNILDITRKFDHYIVSNFLLEYLLILTLEIFTYVAKTFRGKVVLRGQRQMPKLDKDELEIIHFIAGSIMRGYLRIAKRWKDSQKWQLVASSICSKVLVSKPTQGMQANTEWTLSIDRGGLLYVSEKCQKFFELLTIILYDCEERNGSINYEHVIKLVTKSELSLMWDNIFLDSLPECVSVNLMNDVVLCFSKTCGRGIAKKRLNRLRQKPIVSMPTRHLVAKRKTK